MKKFDKIFAGLILLAMVGFWVVIAPATFVAQTSEALPLSAILVPEKTTEIAPTQAEKRRQAEARVIDARTARLKERTQDTPPEDQITNSDFDLNSVPMPTSDEEIFDADEDIPGAPVYY